MKKIALTLSLLLCLGLTACAFDNDRQKGTAIGGLGGAGVGALLGQAIGHDTAGTLIGAAVGAAAGAITGNIVGDHMDEDAKKDAELQYYKNKSQGK